MLCDLNCDMGEGIGNDADLMPFISSANISCGFHAGNSQIIRQTIELALEHGVHMGAHPSFRDKEHFGRREMKLSPDKLYAIVLEQLIKIELLAKEKGATLHHVKPHGALYNLAAKDSLTAKTIAQAVKDFNEVLIVYGLSGSYMISEAKALGLKTASEVFADRTYQEDGNLLPRTHTNALITTVEESIDQVKQMINEGTATSVNGKPVPVVAETICIHGDGVTAVALAKALYRFLNGNEVSEVNSV